MNSKAIVATSGASYTLKSILAMSFQSLFQFMSW